MPIRAPLAPRARRLAPVLLAGVVAAACAPSPPTLPGPAGALPRELSWAEDRFSIEIDRAWRTDQERALLEAAEAHPPASAWVPPAILSADEGSGRRPTPETRPGVEAPVGGGWWYGQFDGILLPFAANADAVRYYLDAVTRLWERHGNERVPMDGAPPTVPDRFYAGGATYRARVERQRPTGPDGATHRVHVELRFYFYCGPVCLLDVSIWRAVDLTDDGTVTGVRGDGHPLVGVS